jgi:methylated-DNA-[protein]-cysteine S-methyltransferase
MRTASSRTARTRGATAGARSDLTLASRTLPVFGHVRLAASAQGLCAIALVDWHDPELWLSQWGDAPRTTGLTPHLERAFSELEQYARQRLTRFTVPLDLGPLPTFTAQVLSTLRALRYGQLTSYRGLAEAAGSPRAARAVGQAVGRNPLPVMIACHRVIAADGTIGGFGLGLDAKRRLLAIEGVELERA